MYSLVEGSCACAVTSKFQLQGMGHQVDAAMRAGYYHRRYSPGYRHRRSRTDENWFIADPPLARHDFVSRGAGAAAEMAG
ncbi:hypothetical protein MJ579_11405 [Klebsiella pneumoniae]|nr:hypothetical protein MJ579_11405 [Klebsiella pneumoniae]